MNPIEVFPTRDGLADAAATALAQALTAPAARAFIAAGGSTPGPVYDRLARSDLHWDRLTVTLTDERWVDPGSEQSNEALLRKRLLVERAAAATFLPLKGTGATLEADATTVDAALGRLLPSAAVLLGMGEDGHMASLFPGAPELAIGLDLGSPRLAMAVPHAGLEPYVPRITLTARALAETAIVIVLISGAAKRAVVERVAADEAYSPPVATMLRQARCPVRVMWAP